MCEASTSTPAKKRHVLSEDAREIIILFYMILLGNLLNTVVQATGVSKSTIVRILKQGRAIDCSEQTSFVVLTPIPKTSPKSSVDNCSEQIIRRIIYNFHIIEKQKPTIAAIYNLIKDDDSIGFLGKKSSLRTLLIKKGCRYVYCLRKHYFFNYILFRWRKTMDHRKILMERHEIRSLRCSYI
ncbi:hypothetical protein RN001_007771 [Aquatica leii]|uniref:Uncharacterized protein n=1 Tax=Aquatica leii TaxID=1421715 RepID=A0AAN7P3C4_9COLE|nr:hypothetical protein RN001_007771 [Aquatica leii]